MIEFFDNTPIGDLDLSKLDTERIPTHVGLIMDGNGRWAKARDLPRTAGHAAGEAALFNTIDGALAAGVRWLSAYTFSTENWTRGPEEVQFLMWFNEDLLIRRRDVLHEKGVRMHFAGDLADPRIPERNRQHMADAEELTKNNDTLNMVFAFNYGGRDEIVRAVRMLAAEVAAGERTVGSIDDEAIASNLWVPNMPDPDLIVRTSGEIRLSNFLLWGSAYAEFVFTETPWPEFGAQPLIDAIVEYQTRARRFGSA
jgi:undecaprenyl diphosphate synthase